MYLSGLFFSVTGMDDAILGEQAYWMSLNGYVKSKLFSGMGQGWEVRQYHFHKLFILVGALWIKIFGWSIFNLKMLSVFLALITGLIYFKTLKKYFNEKTGYYSLIGVILLLINTSVFFYGHIFRPEVMLMLSGLASFYYLMEYNKSGKVTYLIISAILSGLSALIHLNGLIFIFAGVIALFFTKHFKELFIFGIIGSLTSLLYFIDIHSMNDLIQLKSQFFADPNIEEADSNIFMPLLKILDEHKRLFRSPREITLFILYFTLLAVHLKFYIKNHLFVFVYSLTCIVVMSGLSHGITTKYITIYFPVIILTIIIGIQHTFYSRNKNLKYIIGIITLLYFIVHLGYNVHILQKSDNIMIRNDFASNFIEEGDQILSTETMIFNHIETHDMISFLGYRYKRFNYDLTSPDDINRFEIFDFAIKWNRDLIIVDKKLEDQRVLKILNPESLIKGENYYGFVVVINSDELLILRKETS
jgi:hypothetical protein